jgi:hypothetical protein
MLEIAFTTRSLISEKDLGRFRKISLRFSGTILEDIKNIDLHPNKVIV